jgi:putative endonuclease
MRLSRSQNFLEKNNMYFVYILKCADNTLYTGITNDLEKRIEAHNSSKTGAKYTKVRRPVTLVYSEQVTDRSAALKREHILRHFSRAQKLQVIADSYKPKSHIAAAHR